jgi:hypothetical protein
MPSAHSLAGLMKWLTREPWRDAFADVLERHVAGPREAAGIESVEELGEQVGAHWATTLWGCAFEDFLTREVAEAGNIVDDYLKRRGWKENAVDRAYMAALRSSTMSLYEASDIQPGQSFLARDLLRGGEPIRVSEHTATKTIRPWDRLAMRVVEVRGRTIIGGGLLPFEPQLADKLIGMFAGTKKRVAKNAPAVLAELGLDAGDPDVGRLIASATGDAELLRVSAPLFSTLFLADLLERVLDPQLPQLVNGDGEALEFIVLVHRLKSGVTPERIRAALDRAPELDAASPTFWNWLAPKDTGPRRKPRREAKAPSLTTTMDDGSIVLGTVELKARTLELHVNSEGRAERGRAMIAAVLGDLVGTPLMQRQTVEQALAERSDRDRPPRPSGLSPEEERQAVHAALDQHYRRQLDQPVPALGNVSPRRAAKSVKGRGKLVAWLKLLENHAAKQDPAEPMASYDLSWIWRELDVADLRK